MKILKEKDFLKTGSISEIKDALLYRIYLITSIVGVPLVFTNMYFSIVLDLSYFGIITTLMLIPSFIATLFYRKTSYEFKSILLVLTFLIVGFFNILLGAFFGSGLMVLLTGIGLSVVFLPLKKTSIFLSLVSLGLIIFAVLFINKILIINFDMEKSYTSTSSWIAAVLVFFLLSSLLISSFGIINKNLLIKLNKLKTNESELLSKNEQLKKLIDKQEMYQKEIIAEKKKAEESAELKTTFIRNLSHEIRTPLNSIVGFTQILNSSKISAEKRQQFTKIIVKGSNDLQKIIDDILEISILDTKQSKRSLSKKNINDWMEKFSHDFILLNPKQEIEFILKTSSNKDINLETDFFSLEKALGNLLHNSFKFTLDGSVTLGYIIDDREIKIFVKDSGIGIDTKQYENIFEKFVQGDKDISTKFGGLGLGLCIAKEHISNINGKISFESELGKGSTFYITIPISK